MLLKFSKSASDATSHEIGQRIGDKIISALVELYLEEFYLVDYENMSARYHYATYKCTTSNITTRYQSVDSNCSYNLR